MTWCCLCRSCKIWARFTMQCRLPVVGNTTSDSPVMRREASTMPPTRLNSTGRAPVFSTIIVYVTTKKVKAALEEAVFSSN